ncbi:MAG: hypothetical protein EOR72_00050 [Mesorhizobium sp.]|uniref:hypothetical protein n=1 Tax=Mesorhizobium sp. TaxID=1871066 RepID=UPI000FE8C7D7|nr:hypothetical protein [Mesorhizobium sp.]RWM19631.1 MAG: hypothetical protein EOR72_00050 [Mesorhizobium sp.]
MLNADEIVYRCALFPRMVDQGIVPPEKAIADFFTEKDDEGNKVYTISVGRGAMLPDWAAVHDYGCRTAVAANDYLTEKKGGPLIRGEETLHYIGSYKVNVASIMQAPCKLFDLGVFHHPMPNLPEHCNIAMRQNSVDGTRIERSAERTGIIVYLRQSLYDPDSHICECDADLKETLAEIKLSVGPDKPPLLTG